MPSIVARLPMGANNERHSPVNPRLIFSSSFFYASLLPVVIMANSGQTRPTGRSIIIIIQSVKLLFLVSLLTLPCDEDIVEADGVPEDCALNVDRLLFACIAHGSADPWPLPSISARCPMAVTFSLSLAVSPGILLFPSLFFSFSFSVDCGAQSTGSCCKCGVFCCN